MSALLDVDQKLRRAFAAGAELAGTGEDCPAADRLWAVAALEAPPEERLRVAEHTARCAACAEDFRIVVEMVREAAMTKTTPAPNPGTVVVGPWATTTPARRHLWGALAALLFLGAGLAVLWPRIAPPPGPPIYRGNEKAEILSSLGASPKLPRAEALLRWQGPPGALYSIRVTGPDLRLVAEAQDLEKGEHRLRPAELEAYPAGTPFTWQVTAFLADGQRLESGIFRFELVDGSPADGG